MKEIFIWCSSVSHSNIGLQCQLGCCRVSSACRVRFQSGAMSLCLRDRHSLAIAGFSVHWSWGQHLCVELLNKLANSVVPCGAPSPLEAQGSEAGCLLSTVGLCASTPRSPLIWGHWRKPIKPVPLAPQHLLSLHLHVPVLVPSLFISVPSASPAHSDPPYLELFQRIIACMEAGSEKLEISTTFCSSLPVSFKQLWRGKISSPPFPLPLCPSSFSFLPGSKQ